MSDDSSTSAPAPVPTSGPVSEERLAELRARFGGPAAVEAAKSIAQQVAEAPAAAAVAPPVVDDSAAGVDAAAAVEAARLADASRSMQASTGLALIGAPIAATAGAGSMPGITPPTRGGPETDCPACNGTGKLRNACGACKGAGILADNLGNRQPCGRCRGTRFEPGT